MEVDIFIEGLSDTSFSLSENLSDNSQYYWRVDAIDTDSLVTTSEVFSFVVGTLAISDDLQGIPTEYSLSQNYPNPFNPVTMIKYGLPVSGDVTIRITNILGEEIVTLINETQPAGPHQVQWDANKYSSGVYFYRIQANDFQQVKKCLLIK